MITPIVVAVLIWLMTEIADELKILIAIGAGLDIIATFSRYVAIKSLENKSARLEMDVKSERW